jgi:16S rRNA (guanine527-N7)-methyltransferase
MIASPISKTISKAVSRETAEKLEHFAALFIKWSSSINLAAPSTLREFWTRHIEDSLQIHALSPGPFTWIDLGSGGGLPGVVTAIMLTEQSAGWVHLIESSNKKAAFLRTALRETGARGSVHPIRIEKAPDVIEHCDRISARALADLDVLYGYISPWAVRNSDLRCYLHKGRDYRREVEVSNRRWNHDLVEHVSKVDGNSVVLEVSNLSAK